MAYHLDCRGGGPEQIPRLERDTDDSLAHIVVQPEMMPAGSSFG